MGEVYKARDTRLDRTVAIKVLPDHIAKRDDVRERFEREARAVASLNHPHICILYDIGRHENTGYMVMEFMEGETLGDRIAKGPIPLEQALKFAVQIADALDRAHRAGVTHRDVKPGNIMLTRDGVKVLDLGLAKSAPVKPGPTDSTLTNPLTAEGTILGTPQYMAPEQFEGKEADARADIWAFGSVLYEMVTGQKAFRGKSYIGLVSAILTAEPVPMSVKPVSPSWVEHLVRRCLAKDPERRYQSMRDIVLDLEAPARDVPLDAKPNRWPWEVAAGFALLAVVAGGLAWLKTGEAGLPARFDVNPPGVGGGRFTDPQNIGGLAISPDGRTLAFVATSAKGESLLYIRPFDSLEAQALPGTENAGRPFWSPDSKSLAFASGGKLKRVEVSGGPPVTLCNSKFGRGGTWNEDGVILFADREITGLQRIAASGGVPTEVTKISADAGERTHYYPEFLPGGNEFLFLVRNEDPAKSGIYMGALDGRAAVLLQFSPFNGLYDAMSRRLLHIQGNGTMIARRLELDPPRLTGDSVIVAEGVGRVVGANGYAVFSISRNGTLFYGRGGAALKARFGWVDRAGKLLESIGQPVEAGVGGYSLSPDGGNVAYMTAQSDADVWVMPLGRGMSARITFSGGQFPRWSPDSRYLYYKTNNGSFCRKAADGSGEEELLLTGNLDRVTSVSPDGKHMLFGYGDVRVLPLEGERKPAPYLQTKFAEGGAVFSPDGRWIAYNSDESGRDEVYIQGFPERQGKLLVSAEGGSFPRWRADGKELYWIAPDGRTVMAAQVELQVAEVKAGRGEALFRANSSAAEPSRDGRRFLVAVPEGGEAAELPMVVVLNWAAGLGK